MSGKTPANADLIERWAIGMETQVNVAPGDGEPVAGKRSTWSDGINEWFNIRVPKNAATDPTFTDYQIGFPLALHAEGVGMTGWDWKARLSRHFGYDFDALTGHAQGVGIEEKDLEKVKQAACALPYVEVRRSTGGGGIHLYVYLDDAGIPTANHTEHAALARCILGMMSAEVGFDFASAIDACGHVMWIWHRKMSVETHGLEIIKPATKRLGAADLPANWRDHIEVVKGRRAKVRINEVADDNIDPFEALASSRKIIPLDDSHKAQIEALMRSGATTLWVADHHLLQTHTVALRNLMEGAEGRALKLVGVFKTTSEGRDLGTPNCFLFPLPNGAWRAYRFSPGIAEADTWTQDGQGWTTCYFNRFPDLKTACMLFGGVEREQGGYVFSSAEEAIKAAEALGEELKLDGAPEGRKVTLKAHKDGRLVAEIERERSDPALEGWDNKKAKYVKIFTVKTGPEQDDTLDFNQYDGIIRAVKTTAAEHSGWMMKEEKEWVRHPASNIKMLLQSLGNVKNEAEAIMGKAAGRGWRLVTLPFREEYPGGRQWNLDAAQFRFKPAELADDEVPCHPHWDMILDHIGHELTPALRELPWAIEAKLRTGADYLRAWVACAFRDPFQPLPYLFFFGPEDSGKSIFYESLQRLVTKGVVKADGALTSEFNGELSGAVICAVEEKDISKAPGAWPRSKSTSPGGLSRSARCGTIGSSSPIQLTGFRRPTGGRTARCFPAIPGLRPCASVIFSKNRRSPNQRWRCFWTRKPRTSSTRSCAWTYRPRSTGCGCRSSPPPASGKPKKQTRQPWSSSSWSAANGRPMNIPSFPSSTTASRPGSTHRIMRVRRGLGQRSAWAGSCLFDIKSSTATTTGPMFPT